MSISKMGWADMAIVIQKRSHRLGDGSYVFNVRIWDSAHAIDLSAITETDANLLIEILRDGIKDHTNETVEVEH